MLVLPSPKFQLREPMLPSLSLEVSVKLIVRPLALLPKLVAGLRFPLSPPVSETLEKPDVARSIT